MEIEEGFIICPECGTKNSAEKMLCAECGFNLELIKNEKELAEVRRIEAELAARKGTDMLETMNGLERTRLVRFLLATSVYTAIVITITAIFVLALVFRFLAKWPFENTFEVDSRRMADALLKVDAALELDANKGEFREVMREMLAESLRYTTKYENSPYRTNETFTLLRSSAQFYIMSNDAWENELKATYGHVVSSAPSSGVSENVRKLWNSGKASLKRALEKL